MYPLYFWDILAPLVSTPYSAPCLCPRLASRPLFQGIDHQQHSLKRSIILTTLETQPTKTCPFTRHNK